ncbi:hypothetical protein NDU88_004313 [Pleurodeles waltl]|uniref:DNA-directed DNA polymerase n=1 Tax=Pleurodeles waltl TaxID=8319 RepID=A0AAV7RKY8_PLEWA|nr:hypothetical protein NDU88_004313 [Pleurodeles waltl]
MYVSEEENIFIQHALQGGEYRLDRYYLDGYALINGVPTAFEFNGCFYHWCPHCYKPHEFNRLQGTTFEHLHRRNVVKVQYTESSSFAFRTLWEHERLVELTKDAELGTFIKSLQLPAPLEPRNTLFGGCTNATQLYRVAGEGENIHYYDFTSLYPFVNKVKLYPVGHPRIIYRNFKSLDEYFGLFKCQIHCPWKLYCPVLPYRVEDKLMFPLCRTCTESKQTSECRQSDEERLLEGTWCTIEVQTAIEKGYHFCKILKIGTFHTPQPNSFLSTSACFSETNRRHGGILTGASINHRSKSTWLLTMLARVLR